MEEISDGTGVELYTEAALPAQGDMLSAHRVIDLEATQVGAVPATRALAHHAQERLAITIEQWRLVEGPLAFTVTCSCATLDYAVLADGFREAAESLVLAGSP